MSLRTTAWNPQSLIPVKLSRGTISTGKKMSAISLGAVALKSRSTAKLPTSVTALLMMGGLLKANIFVMGVFLLVNACLGIQTLL